MLYREGEEGLGVLAHVFHAKSLEEECQYVSKGTIKDKHSPCQQLPSSTKAWPSFPLSWEAWLEMGRDGG